MFLFPFLLVTLSKINQVTIVCHSAGGGRIGTIVDEENDHRRDGSTGSVILGNEKESLRVSVQHWRKLTLRTLCSHTR